MTNTNYLIHYGIEGQRWGIRRYQNKDGTLTPEGRKRYGYGDDYNRDNYEEDMRYLREQSDRVKSHKKRAIATGAVLGAAASAADRALTKGRDMPILETSRMNVSLSSSDRAAIEGMIVGVGTGIASDAISNKSFEKDKEKILGALARVQNYQISNLKMDKQQSDNIGSALATGNTKRANKLETKTRDSVYDASHVRNTKNKLAELKRNASNMDKKEFMKKLGEIENTLSYKEQVMLDDLITDVYNEKFAKRK